MIQYFVSKLLYSCLKHPQRIFCSLKKKPTSFFFSSISELYHCIEKMMLISNQVPHFLAKRCVLCFNIKLSNSMGHSYPLLTSYWFWNWELLYETERLTGCYLVSRGNPRVKWSDVTICENSAFRALPCLMNWVLWNWPRVQPRRRLTLCLNTHTTT